MKELQTGCPYPIKAIHIFEGELADEARLHEVLEPYRIHGEWFNLNYERLFAVVVNLVLGEDTIKYFGGDGVNQSNHFDRFIKDHWMGSRKPPKNTNQGIDFNKLYKIYEEYCKFQNVAALGPKYFSNKMRGSPIGGKKIDGLYFYTMRLKEDSYLNHDNVRTDNLELKDKEKEDD